MKTNKQTKGEGKRERKRGKKKERKKEHIFIFLLKSICRPLYHFIEFQRFRKLSVSIYSVAMKYAKTLV